MGCEQLLVLWLPLRQPLPGAAAPQRPRAATGTIGPGLGVDWRSGVQAKVGRLLPKWRAARRLAACFLLALVLHVWATTRGATSTTTTNTTTTISTTTSTAWRLGCRGVGVGVETRELEQYLWPSVVRLPLSSTTQDHDRARQDARDHHHHHEQLHALHQRRHPPTEAQVSISVCLPIPPAPPSLSPFHPTIQPPARPYLCPVLSCTNACCSLHLLL